MDEDLILQIKQAADASPDPARAQRNLERFLPLVEDMATLRPRLKAVSKLFACSQFLANYCVNNPADLLWALELMHKPVTRQWVADEARGIFDHAADEAAAMVALRVFKKRWLLVVTLRDLTGEADMVSSMEELSYLAEVAIELALDYAMDLVLKRHGPTNGPFDAADAADAAGAADAADAAGATKKATGGRQMSVIAFGKLGGMEINYSSDVDLMYVYQDTEGMTEGVETPTGIMAGRISAHEYYVKVAEITSSMLNRDTSEGIAYRVDLRLRPNGQKGDLAMSVAAYRQYYEDLGRTWERMALIRARPVAGDPQVGRAFISEVERFVWHHPCDYQEIEEIRSLKKKIDSTFLRDDIKRGYGGIREAEFFVQTFQLIYGSDARALRSYRLMHAVQGLRRMGLVPGDELASLSDAYLHFRRIEHFLQMLDDLQTYRMPSGEVELLSLARKMGFASTAEFISDLRLRRMSVKDMYNSLLGTEEDAHAEALALLEDDFSDGELKGYLAFKGAADMDSALKSIKALRAVMSEPRVHGSRAIVRRSVPHLLDLALSEAAPELALKGLDSFLSSFGLKEAYLSALTDKGILPRGLVRMFTMSRELTRLFLSGPEHLNWLVESMPIRKSLRRQRSELARLVAGAEDPASRIAKYKSMEWLRLGMVFFLGIIDIFELSRYLSHLADAIAGAALELSGAADKGLCMMAMGKLGGRELTYGSDLDVIFVADDSLNATAVAQKALRLMTSYSGHGSIYEVDTRLRPDGSKGQLVKSMQGYRNYYMEHAHPWEVQALLKARPAAGDPALARAFMQMAREVALKRGLELTREALADMRQRIMKERARESEGIDVKLGPGGMGAIEFHVQWLQLQGMAEHPALMVQNTQAAIQRLAAAGILERRDALTVKSVYDYYKKLSTLLRVNGQRVATPDSPIAHVAAIFMGHATPAEMMDCLRGHRETVSRLMQ